MMVLVKASIRKVRLWRCERKTQLLLSCLALHVRAPSTRTGLSEFTRSRCWRQSNSPADGLLGHRYSLSPAEGGRTKHATIGPLAQARPRAGAGIPTFPIAAVLVDEPPAVPAADPVPKRICTRLAHLPLLSRSSARRDRYCRASRRGLRRRGYPLRCGNPHI